MPTTATAEPGNSPPRIQLQVTGLVGDTATVMRNDPDGSIRPVRNAEPATLTAGAWLGYDYEAPFGASVTYTAVTADGARDAPSDSVTLDTDNVWLIHPGVPALSVPIRPEQVLELAERTRPARSAVLEPLGRSHPIVVSDVRGSVRAGLTVLTDTDDERAALVALLTGGVPILVNIPPALGWGVTYEWAAVDAVTEAFRQRGLGPTRAFTLPYTVVTRPVGSLQAEWTYADVLAAYDSYAAVLSAYPTYVDMLANHVLDVEPSGSSA